jgi:hypothetical protein
MVAATLELLFFLLKLLVPSLLLAIAIRVWGPHWSIPATPMVSLVMVLTPAVVMGVFLGYQLWRSNRSNHAYPGRD